MVKAVVACLHLDLLTHVGFIYLGIVENTEYWDAFHQIEAME